MTVRFSRFCTVPLSIQPQPIIHILLLLFQATLDSLNLSFRSFVDTTQNGPKSCTCSSRSLTRILISKTSKNSKEQDTVRSLEISNANYAAALVLLDKRVNKKSLIFQAHIAKIWGLGKVSKGATTQLRECSYSSHLCALRPMGSMQQIRQRYQVFAVTCVLCNTHVAAKT